MVVRKRMGIPQASKRRQSNNMEKAPRISYKIGEEMFKDQEEQHAFELWAFGTIPTTYNLPIMHSWNSRHGDKVWIEESENIQHSLKKMYQLWRECNGQEDAQSNREDEESGEGRQKGERRCCY